jgi:1,4-alpha-glucan branching enzyme
VAGSFNGWTADNCPMDPGEGGVWDLFIPGLQQFDTYHYVIETQTGERLYKADPFAFHTETRPAVWSKLYDLSGFQWNDEPWLRFRASKAVQTCPLNIYELHLGSWRRDGDGNLLSYREITKWLVPYVKEMGYSCVELLPVAEHTADERYGFLCSNFFAPTSRFGTPHDFMYLVDQLHQAGVGVILDWTPACFPQSDFGLSRFDGAPCFEYADPQKAIYPSLPAYFFDFGKGAVRSYLTSCAMYWMRLFHVDGLRMDSVSNMIYLDYGGRCWKPNARGGRENLEAVSLLRHLNNRIHGEFPGTITVADETTTWPFVTHSTKKG